jgi:hypothetical protein
LDDNLITDYYYLTVINLPPFLESIPKNASYFAGSSFFYTLPTAVDPEKGPVSITVVSKLSPYITHQGEYKFMI